MYYGDDDSYGYDARRCPRHPEVTTASDDGLIDGLCHRCEAEMDDAAALDEQAMWLHVEARLAEERERLAAEAASYDDADDAPAWWEA
jgi:hypothetical protein